MAIMRRELGENYHSWKVCNGMHFISQPSLRELSSVARLALLDKGLIYAGAKHEYRRIDLSVGCAFDTFAENGCVCQSLPDSNGAFDGRDSDGVEVSFCVTQVKIVR